MNVISTSSGSSAAFTPRQSSLATCPSPLTFCLWPLALFLCLTGCGTSEPSAPITPPAASTSVTAVSPADDAVASAAAPVAPDVPPPLPAVELEDGFRWLSLDDFEIFYSKPAGGAVVWQAVPEQHGFDCLGQPRGYLHSKASFGDFTLRLSYRFPGPASLTSSADFKGNTGFMLHINGPHRQWPVSLEVQGKYPEMGMIKSNGGAAAVTASDLPEARTAALKAPGEWHAVEIVSAGGAVTSFINGQKICESQPGELTAGLIGFQSEDFPVQFRHIRIRAADAP